MHGQTATRRRNFLSWMAGLFLLAQFAAPVQAEAPQIIPQIGHAGKITELFFSPDDRYLFTGSNDHSIKLWDVETGRLVRTFKEKDLNFAFGFAVSKDGQTVVSAPRNKTVRILDATSGRILRTHKIGVEIGVGNLLALMDDSSGFVIGSDDGKLRLFDLRSGRPVRTIKALKTISSGGYNAFLTGLIALDGGKLLLSGARGDDVRLWDAKSGRLVRIFARERRFTKKEVSSPKKTSTEPLAVSPDGRIVMQGGWDGKLRAWDFHTGRLLYSVQAFGPLPTSERLSADDDGTIPLDSLAITPDGQNVVTATSWGLLGTEEGVVKVWDVSSGRLVRSINLSTRDWISALALTSDGSRLVVAGGRGKGYDLYLLDFASGTVLHNFRRSIVPVRSLSLAAQAKRLVSSDQSGERLWNLESGQLLATPKETIGGGVAFDERARQFIAASSGTLLRLDAESGQIVGRIETDSRFLPDVALSRDGRQLFAVSSENEEQTSYTLALFDPATGQRLLSQPDVAIIPSAIALSPDGRSLLVAEWDRDHESKNTTLYQYDTAKLQMTRKLVDPADRSGGHATTHAVAFTPDGRHVLSIGDYGLTLWDYSSGKVIRTIEDSFDAVAPTPSSEHAATAGANGDVRLWDLGTGKQVRAFHGHAGSVNDVEVSSDGRRLVSAGEDGTIRLWNIETGEAIATFIANAEGEWLVITPEGYFAASPKGGDMLNAVSGMSVFSVDQLYQTLYRPNLVREKLAGDPAGKVRKAARELDLEKVLASGAAPAVTFASPAEGFVSEEAEVDIDIRLAAREGGIGRVEWFVNGVNLVGEERGFVAVAPDADGKTVTRSRSFELELGTNDIEVVAFNEAGLIASPPARLRIEVKGTAATELPDLYVLAVGVNDYFDSALRLNFSVPDATALGEALRKAGVGYYQNTHITTLLDGAATAAGLDQAFAALADKVRPGDVFIFYVAGHGKTLDGRYYFIPQDFVYSSDAAIPAGAVGQDHWQQWLARIKARKSLILYDTCESGTLADEGFGSRGLEQVAALHRLIRATGRMVMSATTGDAPALEGYQGHGIFTYALLEGLAHADLNQNGLIELTELAGYVDHRVPEISYERFGERQIPRKRDIGSDYALGRRVPDAVPRPDADAVAISGRPTHVVIQPAELFGAASEAGDVLQRLAPGTVVTILRSDEGGFVLIAREGKRIGYARAEKLAPLQ